jgi:hypothetical protein
VCGKGGGDDSQLRYITGKQSLFLFKTTQSSRGELKLVNKKKKGFLSIFICLSNK